MNNTKYGIIEIGSNNTKVHVYENNVLIYDALTTIQLKKNYQLENKILDADLEKICEVIKDALKYTKNIYIFGCSIFRKLSEKELNEINEIIYSKFGLKIEVISQEDEAFYTALGCYNNIDYDKDICVFIGGGGSTELVFVKNKEIIDKKYYNFGVVDVTKSYPSLSADIPECTFDEVYEHIKELMGKIDNKADILILAGGDHIYWYNNANYDLNDNVLYNSDRQKYMIARDLSDEYDHDALVTSLDKIRNRSDNPLWFDGSRAMKIITNYISHEIDAKYIIPTNINMEDGLKERINNN